MNNQEFVRKFANGATKGRYGNLFIEGDTLYSYGTHFPLVVRKDWGKGIQFLVNGDIYSVSTTHHTSLCIQECKPNVQIPFSALHSARVIAVMSRWLVGEPQLQIVDYRRDTWETVCQICQKPVLWDSNQNPYDYIHPDGSPLCMHKSSNPEAHDVGGTTSIHTLGAVLFKHNKRYFLSSTDNQEKGRRAYFLSELAKPVKTVDAAFEGLKPIEVLEAERNGIDVKRQGDCFFVKTELRSKDFQSLTAKNYRLLESNHYASESKAKGKGLIYARGVIRHVPERRASDHKRLCLGKPAWWFAAKNTAKASWSAVGNGD